MKLDKKSIVVTGASSGMGKEIVKTFVREGAYVVAVARRTERLEALARELEGEAGKVIPCTGDVSVQADNERAIDLAVREFGRLDILVNNAGIMDDMSPIGAATNEKLEKIFAVNVNGPFYAMRKAVQIFESQQGSGNIINVVSEGAFHTCAGVVYCASKAALVSMTKNTAFMYQTKSIRCNAIAPGGIATEISATMGHPNVEGYSRVKNVLACAPQVGAPEAIANAALFLASDDSAYINGDVLMVDGGWCAM